MVAVACPVPTAVQVRPAASSAPSAPNTWPASCWASAREGLGLVGGLGLGCLVAVDGGLVVGPLALSRLLAGERRLGQAAQPVACRVGLIHGLPPDKTGEEALKALQKPRWRSALLGGGALQPVRVDRIEPDRCGAEQIRCDADRRSGARQVHLLRQNDSFGKHRQATYFMMPVIGAR